MPPWLTKRDKYRITHGSCGQPAVYCQTQINQYWIVMKAAFLLGVATSFLSVATSAYGWTGTSDDKWRSGWGQGVSEAQVTQGSGNAIYVACSRDMDSSISVTIAGGSPPRNSDAIFMFDRQKPETVQFDDRGGIGSSCRVCASNFTYVLDKLRKHKSVFIRLSDGREATFSLNGANAAIGECVPGFDR